MASQLRTPVQNLEKPKTVFPLSSEKSPPSKSPVRKKTALCVGESGVGQEPQTSQREASISRPTIRRKLLSPGERFIQEKRHAIAEKLAQSADERKALEDCYRIIKEAASGNNLSGQRCSNCHYRNHTVKVPIKRNFFSHIFEIYRLKYTIPKFEMFRVKINDVTSLQTCAILPLKMVFELCGQNTT